MTVQLGGTLVAADASAAGMMHTSHEDKCDSQSQAASVLSHSQERSHDKDDVQTGRVEETKQSCAPER